MLTTLLALKILAGSAIVHSPQLPHQEVENGYDDYIRAGKIAAGESFKRLKNATGSPLLMAKNYHAQIEPIYRLVQSGNKKVSLGRTETLKFDTLFPELTNFRTIAIGLTESAYYEVAHGNPSRGTSMLIETSRFCERMDSTLIGFLVGAAMEAIVLRQIQVLLPRLPISELSRLEDLATFMIRDTGRLERTIVSEAEMAKQSMADPKSIIDGYLEDYEFATRLKNSSPQELKAMLDRFTAVTDHRTSVILQMFKKPEGEWKEELQEESEFDALTPVFASVFGSMARTRTQWRLVRLATKIESYRWEHGQLPVQLGDCAPKEWLSDPLSGKAFKYGVISPLEYEVYSEGGLNLGRVDIKYIRPKVVADPEP